MVRHINSLSILKGFWWLHHNLERGDILVSASAWVQSSCLFGGETNQSPSTTVILISERFSHGLVNPSSFPTLQTFPCHFLVKGIPSYIFLFLKKTLITFVKSKTKTRIFITRPNQSSRRQYKVIQNRSAVIYS